MTWLRHDWRSERGAVAAFEMILLLAFLIIPAFATVAQIPRWVDAESTAQLAAQEAARTMVTATSEADGRARVGPLVASIAENHGLAAGDVSVVVEGTWERGQDFEVTVTLSIPAIVVPPIGEFLPLVTTVTRSHTERLDDFREVE